MNQLSEVLSKIDSKDAVIIADRYIAYKYSELFVIIGFISVLALITIAGMFLGYKIVKKIIKENS